MPGVCGSSRSNVHSARSRAHTARNALTEPFSCTSVIVHPPLAPLPRPTVNSIRKRTAFCTRWPVDGSYASSRRARSAPSGCGSGRRTGASKRRASERVDATLSRERRAIACVRQWKRLENQPLTSPTAGGTSSDFGEPRVGELPLLRGVESWKSIVGAAGGWLLN